jgi:Na+-translocating ferredoxin:NAD+ oxidoreductase subunit B
MGDEAYYKLAKVLDTLPNGFPATESGVEIKLLKKIFSPEQAELFCRLRLTFETTEQIATRTGLPLERLEKKLISMAAGGQIFMIKMNKVRYFRMLPWIFGIYEFQLNCLDEEFALLHNEYEPFYLRQFFSQKPQLMQTLAIKEGITVHQEALPYEKVSTLIENNQSFLVNECICKKERGLLGQPCDRPREVCLFIAPLPGVFDKSRTGRVITKTEAFELLKKTEEQGLVHLTSNVQFGQLFICNCCKCCCGVLRSINEFGIPAPLVINSHYYAEISADACSGCGICADERCQVNAIAAAEDSYRILPERCIGCGLCISTCPMAAIRLVHKDPAAIAPPPLTEDAWFVERGASRGVDFSKFR